MLSLSPLGLKQFVKIIAVLHRMSRAIRIRLQPNRVLELFGVNDGKLASLQVLFGETFFLRDSDFLSVPSWEVTVDSKHLMLALRTSAFLAVDKLFFCLASNTPFLRFEFHCAYGVICTKHVPQVEVSIGNFPSLIPESMHACTSLSVRPAVLGQVLSYCTEISHGLQVRLSSQPVVQFTTVDLIANTSSTSVSLALNSFEAVTRPRHSPQTHSQPEPVALEETFLFPMTELKLLVSLLAPHDSAVSGIFSKSRISWRAKIGLDVDFALVLPVAADSAHVGVSQPPSQPPLEVLASQPSVLHATPQAAAPENFETSEDISDEAIRIALSGDDAPPTAPGEFIPGTPSQHNRRDSLHDLFDALW